HPPAPEPPNTRPSRRQPPRATTHIDASLPPRSLPTEPEPIAPTPSLPDAAPSSRRRGKHPLTPELFLSRPRNVKATRPNPFAVQRSRAAVTPEKVTVEGQGGARIGQRVALACRIAYGPGHGSRPRSFQDRKLHASARLSSPLPEGATMARSVEY